jgi:hypothetical protein
MATERRQLEAAGPSGRARGRASRAAGPSHADLKSHSLHLSCGRAGKGAEYPSQFNRPLQNENDRQPRGVS